MFLVAFSGPASPVFVAEHDRPTVVVAAQRKPTLRNVSLALEESSLNREDLCTIRDRDRLLE